MRENPGGLTLNWQRLVTEAIARRKLERLTQREHAALAGVSVPTIAAFDRGETTVSLAKAFDILRVVGLLHEPKEGGAQERFLRESIDRWQSLTAGLPTGNPAQFPDGFCRVDYCLEGELKQFTPKQFDGVLRDAVTHHTGWPPFLVLDREDLGPQEVNGTIEAWFKPADRASRAFGKDPSMCDFWRAAPSGRFFLMRGYDEDGQETFAPGSIFDTTLPIWRLGEVLLHAERTAALMAKGAPNDITIRMRVLYTGMQGRQLRNWANPLSGMTLVGRPARSDEVLLEAEIPAEGIKDRLAQHILPLVSAIYERFDVEGLAIEQVRAEVAGLLKGRP